MSFWLVSLTFLKTIIQFALAQDFLVMAVKGLWNFSQLKKDMYSHLIVGNCSKCCWKVLNTHECRAKYSSK